MRAAARVVVLVVAVGTALAEPVSTQTPAAQLAGKVGDYLTQWVSEIANVVAQEDFELASARSRSASRIRSEFLFVQDPVTGRDWMIFRDVSHVDGVVRREREERIRELFVEPPSNFVQRAREIFLDSATFVPPVLNPYFAAAFLQRNYQPRFRLGTKAAGEGWPAGVTALTFLETAKPTLLRNGTRGEQDSPTRGTAWVEQATGRILETELQVKVGRSTTTLRTTFARDDRLATMVPARMQTKEPDGVASYTNFRRFNVKTDAAIAAPNDAPGNAPDPPPQRAPGKP